MLNKIKYKKINLLSTTYANKLIDKSNYFYFF